MPTWLVVAILMLWAWEAGSWWERRKWKPKPSDLVPLNWDDDTLTITRDQRTRVVRGVFPILH